MKGALDGPKNTLRAKGSRELHGEHNDGSTELHDLDGRRQVRTNYGFIIICTSAYICMYKFWLHYVYLKS